MEIRIKTPKVQPLIELKAGDCFEHCGDYYIVTDEIDKVNNEIECVDLKSGSVEYYIFTTNVFKLDAQITLRRLGEET